jgi:hypothetical protein
LEHILKESGILAEANWWKKYLKRGKRRTKNVIKRRKKIA